MLTVADPNGGVQRHLLPGSLLWRKDSYVGVVDHYGILLQAFPPVVAHIDKSIEGYLQPRVESYEQFAAGRQVMGEPVAEAIPLEVMWPRVNEIARVKRPFGLMAFGDTWNCESFARHVREGIARSTQAISAKEALVILGVTVGVVALIATATKG